MSSICCCSNLQGPASLGPQLLAVEGHPAPFQPGSLGYPVCGCFECVYTCTQRACLVPSSKQVHRHLSPFQHDNRRGNIAELSTRERGVGRQRVRVSLIIHTPWPRWRPDLRRICEPWACGTWPHHFRQISLETSCHLESSTARRLSPQDSSLPHPVHEWCCLGVKVNVLYVNWGVPSFVVLVVYPIDGVSVDYAIGVCTPGNPGSGAAMDPRNHS